MRPKCKFVACDTMNFWIENKLEALKKVLARVDMVVLNDGEARQLSGEVNLVKAAKAVQKMGPSIVIVKKGEHGALLFHGDKFFILPAFPLEDVFDPTGAGDTFAGGVMGYLTKTQDFGFESLKSAVVYGAIVASFTVENFGLERLRKLKDGELDKRLDDFRRLCKF